MAGALGCVVEHRVQGICAADRVCVCYWLVSLLSRLRLFTLSSIDRQPPPRAPPSGWPAATRRACCSRGQERPAPRPGRLASLKKSKEPAARESVSLTGGIFKAGPCVLLAGAEGTASMCEEELEAHKAGRATQGPSACRGLEHRPRPTFQTRACCRASCPHASSCFTAVTGCRRPPCAKRHVCAPPIKPCSLSESPCPLCVRA